MIYKILEALLWGFSCGIAGSVYRSLAYEPFFSRWWQFGARYERRWFFKPVWGCAFCISGQLALWSYGIYHIIAPALRVAGLFPSALAHYTTQGLKGLFCLILAITAAIGTAKIFYKKIE